MMKKIVVIFAVLIGVFLTACTTQSTFICDHCGEEKETANHLIGKVDMEICDDCYDDYLQGDWGSKYEK